MGSGRSVLKISFHFLGGWIGLNIIFIPRKLLYFIYLLAYFFCQLIISANNTGLLLLIVNLQMLSITMTKWKIHKKMKVSFLKNVSVVLATITKRISEIELHWVANARSPFWQSPTFLRLLFQAIDALIEGIQVVFSLFKLNLDICSLSLFYSLIRSV